MNFYKIMTTQYSQKTNHLNKLNDLTLCPLPL